MIIAIDVDGVLIDIDTPWREKYNRLSGDNLRKEDVVVWESHTLVKPEWQKKYYGLRTPDLYEVARPIEGAVAGVRLLKRLGYTPVALTHDTRRYAAQKKRAIERLFPEIHSIVFAKDKRAVMPGTLLIDDAAHNRPDILLHQPWNARATSPYPWVRAYSWAEIVDYVMELTYVGGKPYPAR